MSRQTSFPVPLYAPDAPISGSGVARSEHSSTGWGEKGGLQPDIESVLELLKLAPELWRTRIQTTECISWRDRPEGPFRHRAPAPRSFSPEFPWEQLTELGIEGPFEYWCALAVLCGCPALEVCHFDGILDGPSPLRCSEKIAPTGA
jgi:hypothetical protein